MNSFFEAMNLKAIYSVNCGVDSFNPVNAIISARIAELILLELQIFKIENNSSSKKKNILAIKKYYLNNHDHKGTILELLMEVHIKYEVILSFE